MNMFVDPTKHPFLFQPTSHKHSKKHTKTHMKKIITNTKSLTTPTKISDSSKISWQYTNLGPLVLQTPYFVTTLRKRHQYSNLDANSVIYCSERKWFALKHVVVKGTFGINFRHFVIDIKFSLLLTLLTMQHTIITSSNNL